MMGTSFFLLFSSVFSLSVSAQELSQTADLAIRAVPSDPAPGQTIVLEAISFSVDLSQASLSWTYGGKPVASGFGKTRISVLAPISGAVATATVTVSAAGTGQLSASTTFHPGSVDLLWEGASSSVPPFYKGRPLLARGGFIRVVAIPSSGAPKQASYQWSRNDSAQPALSGAGKSSILLQNTTFEQQEKINLSIQGGLFQGTGALTIGPQPLSVVAYQKKKDLLIIQTDLSLKSPLPAQVPPWYLNHSFSHYRMAIQMISYLP